MNCAICENSPGEVIDACTFFLNNKLYDEITNILACPKCGYVWLHPKISEDALNKHYSAQGRIATETRAYGEQLQMLKDNVQLKDARVLDIGAYDGRLLKLIAQEDAEAVLYVEPDSDATKAGFRTLGDALHVLGKRSLDLITMGHVFEHLQDPVDVLSKCTDLLKPGGTLFIEVPDLEDPQVQLVPYWTPFHQSYFTAHTLSYMLEKAGYKVVAIDYTGYRAFRVIARCFTHAEPNQGDTPPAQPSYAGIAKYKLQRPKLIEELRERLSWLEHENLVIFGAGDHTRWLLRYFPDLLSNTSCILDSDTTKQGTTFMGLIIEDPRDCPDEADRIIISSYDTQDEMATIVGKRALLLYEDVRAYDVWLGGEDAVV